MEIVTIRSARAPIEGAGSGGSVSDLAIEFRPTGLFLPELKLWLDPHRAQVGTDIVFVSHAHADHIGAHREVILSEPTAHLMRARVGGERTEHVLAFGEPRTFRVDARAFAITLLPAGHILGSAMALVESAGETLLYTGDFQLRGSLCAERCAPAAARGCDVLVMETTFGRPQYRFPPAAEVMQAVVRFCRETLDGGETPVLLSYSLGKSQELLCGFAEAGLAIMVHPQVQKITRVYERLGWRFPPYEVFTAERARGHVLICPTGGARVAALAEVGPTRRAVVTGWAIDPRCRFRYGADAAFPLSDHADFSDLIEFVRQVAPKRVLTLHGFAADFAQALRERGFDARALSEDEQLYLPLRFGGTAPAS